MMKTHRLLSWNISALLLIFSHGEGKSFWRGTTGILEGRVLDAESRQPLVGVNVVIAGTPLGSATDANGFYEIANVKGGVYEVTFSIVGYKKLLVKEVVILPDLRNKLNMTMEQTAIELETIEVRAERPLIQKDQASTAFAIGESKLNRLPVARFQDVVSLQPGTTVEGNVRGGKTSEVLFLIDGLPAQDVASGGLGTSLPRSSIAGMTIHTGGYNAEYGNALSGVVNVITKGGETSVIGVRYERDQWIPTKWNSQVDRHNELDLILGGPIVSGKLFGFFANTITYTDTRWWQDFKQFFSSPIQKEYSGFGKIEYHIEPTLRITLQGIYSINRWRDYEFSWRFNLDGLPERGRDSYRIATMLSHTLSPTMYYNVSLSRFQREDVLGRKLEAMLQPLPYEYDFFLRYVVEGDRVWHGASQQIVNSVKGDITAHLERTHLVKAGFELSAHEVNSDVIIYKPQLTYYGKPISNKPMLNQSDSYRYFPKSGSAYVQDKIEFARDGSNMSVGVRWDFLDPAVDRPLVEFVQTGPNQYDQILRGYARAKFKHQFSPRLSFAAPTGTSSFFFVNFGHYFQFPLFEYLYSGLSPAQIQQGTRNVLLGNPDLEPERTIAWEAGFKHGVTANTVFSATYFHKVFRNQVDAKTLIPFDSKYAGDYGFAGYVNNAEATSTGLEFVVSRERGDQVSGSISYTYMVTEGISEYVDQSINFAQWGFPLAVKPFPLSWDQRHTIKVDADFTLLGGVESNLVVLFNSPRPYTYFPTRDGIRPIDTTKAFVPNNRRMKNVLMLHWKLSRSFPIWGEGRTISIYADIRNTLNARNVRWIDSSGKVGGELGDPDAYYDPRRIRIGLRFSL